MRKQRLLFLAFLVLSVAPANAALTVFQQFNGTVGLSTDGWGSSSLSSGTISASVPAGSTVLGAYLYSAYWSGMSTATVTLDGTTVNFTTNVPNPTACCSLGHRRADVTSIVKPVIDAGAGGVYDFTVTETSTGLIDGEALVVVYSNASLPESTVGILDGFAAVTGDSTAINFANPLDPTQAGFFAEMRLGIGFSCCDTDVGQSSRVEVNGTVITEEAGSNDDGNAANGGLITVGGFNDPLSPLLPSYTTDRERYDLAPYITNGDMSISVETFNASQDDNVFLAAFYTLGRAGINEPPPPPNGDVPEPGTVSLMVSGLAAIVARTRIARRFIQK